MGAEQMMDTAPVRGGGPRTGPCVPAATLAVWHFREAGTAGQAEYALLRLRKERRVPVHDAAVVSWPDGVAHPSARQLQSLGGPDSLGEAFWGLLFGIAYFIPLLDPGDGAPAAAIDGALTAAGIERAFIARLRPALRPGGSALFVLGAETALVLADEALARARDGEPARAVLSSAQVRNLRAVFAAH